MLRKKCQDRISNKAQDVEILFAGEKPAGLATNLRRVYGDSDGPLALAYCRSVTPLRLGALMSAGGYNTASARIREAVEDAHD
jgi:hypothetical protein